ncbi:MAG: hypothetical protein LBE18_06470 [Planctomycetaceae bacterium]|jgi:chromosomal replication initiator protein|nr:hypothetical protein [Planctomycetaceae bacterium]
MDKSIHIIPLSGKPLEFDVSSWQDNGTSEKINKQVHGRVSKQRGVKSVKSSLSGHGNLLLQVADNGFLVGEENYAVERVINMLFDGLLVRENLPVLFYGRGGTGKTHLLQGIFDLRRKGAVKRQRDVLIKAADFARFFAEAIDLKATDDFRRRFRDVTMLLVDDIEQLEGKVVVLEEFQHTLDILIAADIPVILTSRTLPKFAPRLFDRIISGTTVPIMLPDIAVRKYFIERLLSAFRVSIADSALVYAANVLQSSIPEIYGIIAGMVCKSMIDDVKIDTSYFKQFLKGRVDKRRIPIEQIVKIVAANFSYKVAEIRGSSRNKTLAMARAIAVYFARRESGLTLKQIAKFFGNRDQATIRHLIQKIEYEQKNDNSLKLKLAAIAEKFT